MTIRAKIETGLETGHSDRGGEVTAHSQRGALRIDLSVSKAISSKEGEKVDRILQMLLTNQLKVNIDSKLRKCDDFIY